MRVDVAIAGAGPVGCALALLLADAGGSVALIEARSRETHESPAFRPIALSYASRLVLERIGAWQGLTATAIGSIHVSQADRPGRTVFTAGDAGVPELGCVTGYGELSRALLAQVVARIPECRFGAGIQRATPGDAEIALELGDGTRMTASCLVHAEGGSEAMSEKRYAQDALVAEVQTDPAPFGRAWERFTHEGPLALLPMASGYAVVWAAQPARIAALAALPPEAFVSALQQAFGQRAGRILRVTARTVVPLTLRQRSLRVGMRQAFVGNAAQTLHPVAGQGLNLGLRDARELARTIAAHKDPGDPVALGAYAGLRRFDTRATIAVTDLLATLFTDNSAPGAAIRAGGMLALDACGPARRFFARRMVYGASAIP